MAFLKSSDWEVMLIGGNYERYRKKFKIDSSKEIIWAREYVSAMGLYELGIYGMKVGSSVLMILFPGFYTWLPYSMLLEISRK